MKILFITQYFPPEIGAAPSRSFDLLQEISKKGHEIVVLSETPHYPSSTIVEKYKYSSFYKEDYYELKVIRTFVVVSKRKNFFQRFMLYSSFFVSSIIGAFHVHDVDLVIATSPPLTVGLAGWVVSKLKKCKFVLDIRDLWPDSALALGEIEKGFVFHVLKRMELFLYDAADCITIAVFGFRDYMKNIGISEAKIVDLPNGANIDVFYARKDEKHIRHRFAWEGKFLILFSGNHGLAQGLEYLLEVADSMKELKELLFIFIGDGIVKEKIKQLKKKMNLEQVIFLDKQQRELMPFFISSMDVCLVPLIKHNLFLNALPSKMFEYMACEKPVIVSIDGEARNLIETSGTGLFVEPEDVPAMKSAILKLYHDRQLCREMGQKGREWVSHHFSRKEIAEAFEKKLNKLI